MATPLLRALKSRWPECRITWLVDRGSAAILDGNPLIDDIVVFDFTTWRRLLRRGRLLAYTREALSLRRRLGVYDAAINVTAEKFWTSWFLPAPVRIGLYPSARIGPLAGLSYTHATARDRSRWPHKTRYWLSPADFLGVPGPHDERLVLAVSEEDRRSVSEFLNAQPGYDPNRSLIVLHPGTSASSKCWPPENYAAVAAALSDRANIVLSGGPGEESLIEAVLASLPPGVPAPIVAAGRLGGIGRAAALVAQSTAVVTGDTSILHIATALGVPFVGLYGSTRPGASAPLTGRHVLLYDDTISCAPCNRSHCPLTGPDHLRCLYAIAPPQVLSALQSLLGDMLHDRGREFFDAPTA